jgi:hypothetical protein
MSKKTKVKKKKSGSKSKRPDWLLSVSSDDPRVVGLCMYWVDNAVRTTTGKVCKYKAAHRKSLYQQFCALLANECANTGSKINPRQWAFELGISMPDKELPTIIQFTVFSTFYEAMTTSIHLVEESLVENGFEIDTDVSVAFYSECVSLKSVDNGLELSTLSMDDSEGVNLSLVFDYDGDDIAVNHN